MRWSSSTTKSLFVSVVLIVMNLLAMKPENQDKDSTGNFRKLSRLFSFSTRQSEFDQDKPKQNKQHQQGVKVVENLKSLFF